MKKGDFKEECDMGIRWNQELKRLAMLFLAIFVTALALGNLCVRIYIGQVRNEYKQLLAVIFGNVLEAYPEVEEEELIWILNNKENVSVGASIMARYGILEGAESRSFAVQERQLALLQWGVTFFILLLMLALAVFFMSYIRQRQNGIARLEAYVDAVDLGIGGLEIEENEDDELSGLRNEIFKLTVLLRQQADRAVAQRHALADSVADISHQLKTPLTSLMVLADNLAEGTQLDESTRRRFLSEITRQLAGMSWLVTTMLKLSRFDAGVVELSKKEIQVQDFVDEVLDRLEATAEWKSITFKVILSGTEYVLADKGWTGEALMNIVKNAIEHSPEGSSVEISCEENDVYTQIQVRDFGVGITEEERAKMFQRFYNRKTNKEDSTGIGLSLAKEIMEKQGGSILVDSKEGKGTSFKLRFLKQ